MTRHPLSDSRRRHPFRTALTALLCAAGALVVAPPAMACGCGGVVAEPGHRTTVDQETVLLTGNGTTETVHMQLSMKSDADDLGLLVPTPTPATVALGDPEVFSDLSYVIRPRPVEKFHLFGPAVLFGSDSDSAGRAGAPASTGGGVQAISTVNLGPLEATTLRADDPVALQKWLGEHHYQLSENLATQVKPYVEENWAFVAVRLTQQGRQLQGELPPLVMTFDSDHLVYPMRMSRAADHPESVRTYVLGAHRVQRTDPTATGADPAGITFAGTVPAADVSSDSLRRLLTDAPYLTVVDQYLSEPTTAISSDFTFDRAPTDEAHYATYTVDTYGIPIDIAVILLVLLVGVGVLVWRLVRRRRVRIRTLAG